MLEPLFEEPGQTVCRMAPIARITTDDGAEIGFEGRLWLDGALGLWEGQFDSTTRHACYQAFLQREQ